MTLIWSPRPGIDRRATKMECCREAVRDEGRWLSYHQCTRKALVQREVDGETYGFCKQHDPVAVEKKRKETHAKWDAEWAAKDEQRRIERLMPECKTALEQIAAGHNDPRSLAIEVLAKFSPDERGEG